MSCSTLHAFDKNGQIYDVKEYRNAWHGPMLIWTKLGEKYKVNEVTNMLLDSKKAEEIWELAYRQDVAECDRITMATTFDRFVVYKKDFEKVINAFHECAKSLPAHCHINQQANDIEALIKDENVIAIAWTGTSVADDVWSSRELDGEEELPYNLFKHNLHTDLFEKIK